MKSILILLALALGSVFLAGCGSKDEASDTTTATPSSNGATVAPGHIGGAGSAATPGKPQGVQPGAPQ